MLRILFNTTRMVRTPKQKHERRIKCEVGPRCGRSFSCARDGAHDFGNNSQCIPTLVARTVHGPSDMSDV